MLRLDTPIRLWLFFHVFRKSDPLSSAIRSYRELKAIGTSRMGTLRCREALLKKCPQHFQRLWTICLGAVLGSLISESRHIGSRGIHVDIHHTRGTTRMEVTYSRHPSHIPAFRWRNILAAAANVELKGLLINALPCP